MTDEEVNNLSSSMAALTKQIEKNNAALLIGSKTVDDQSKDFEEILKNSQKIEKSEKRQNGYLKEVGKSLKDTLNTTIKFSGTLASIGSTAFFANVVKDMVDLDNKMTALSVRMGKGTAGIGILKNSVHDLQKEFGASYISAVEIVEELAKDKYVGNITEAAAGVNLFSRASGVADGNIVELTNNLSKMGGLSTKSINSMYAEMTKVQQSVGISDKGMNDLVGTINEMAFNMSAFGKSSEEIRRMTTETAALVGAMEKVGISASRSSQLISQLTDPDKIEDNIMLYSQLGISMEDAMSGSIDETMLGPQFKEMADRITQMGPIAGSQFARSMGLSYKEVTRMAKMEAEDAKKIADEASTPEDQALEVMKKLEASTEGIGKKFETGLNKVEGKLKSLPTTLLLGFAFVVPLIIDKAKKLYHKIFDKKEIQASVDTAIVPSMVNGVKKAGAQIKGETKKLGNTITGNIDQWFDSTRVGGFFRGVNKRADAAMARFNKESFADKFLKVSEKNMSDSLQAKLTQIDADSEKIFSNLESLGISTTGLTQSNGDINLTKLQEQLGKFDSKKDQEQIKAVDALVKSYARLNKTKGTYEKQLGRLSKRQKAQINLEKAEAKLQEYKNKLDSQTAEFKKLVTNHQKDYNDKMIEAARLTKEAASLSGEGKKAAESKAKQLEKEAKGLQKVINKKKDDIRTTKKRLSLAQKLKDHNQSQYDSDLGGPKSGLVKIAKGAWTNAKEAFSNTKTGERAAAFGGGFKGGIKGVGLSAALGVGKALLTPIKFVAKGIGSLLKTIGPMAIISTIIGKLLQKIQDPLEGMIDQVVNIMSPIVEAFMPVIESLMNTVATKILPIMLDLSSKMLTVLHYLLKPVYWIMKALSYIPGKFGNAMGGIADALDEATGPAVTGALKTASTNLSNATIKMEKSSDNLDEAAKEERDENEPVTINATGASLVANGYTDPSVTANRRMTSTTTVVSQEQNSTQKDLDDFRKEERDKEKSEKLDKINSNSNSLPKMLQVLEQILEKITGEDIDIYYKAPEPISVENKKPI